MRSLQILFTVILMFLIACAGCEKEISDEMGELVTDFEASSERPDERWRYAYDFDGDQVHDSISYAYSNGAQCCYQLIIHLSEKQSALMLPIYIDGGSRGLNLDKPDQFSISDIDHNKISEICVNLDHYRRNRNDKALAQLHEKYQFNGTKVLISLESGSLQIKDHEIK